MTLRSAQSVFSKRRLVLLASVAGIGAIVMLAGPGFRPIEFNGTAAHAIEATQPAVGFADLIARVKPAVIAVRVKIERSSNTIGSGSDELSPFEGTPFEKFFKQFGMPNMPNGRQVLTGEGSGFFISADGYAVTNNHVVEQAKTVEIKTDDGKTYTAKVIGTDKKTDVALIKVDGRNDFPFVTFADKPPRVGDWVIAVGNPFGLSGTATAGIVSARGRDIGSGPYDDFIQIDAPINKGNSGGPAFNVEGKVIAVNTAIYSPSGGSVGIGFGIPAETVKAVVAQLKDKGHVDRGWIGVKIQTVTPAIASSLGMTTPQGAIVDEAQPDGPAAKAGLKTGDVITAVDGATVKDSRELARKIGSLPPGTSVKLSVLRDGSTRTVSVSLAKMPNEQQANAAFGNENEESGSNVPHLGLTLAPANRVAGAGSKGVVVTAVDPDSKAAEQGLKAGDVILEVAGKSVANVSQVRSAVAAAKSEGKRAVLMRVKSSDGNRFVAIPLA